MRLEIFLSGFHRAQRFHLRACQWEQLDSCELCPLPTDSTTPVWACYPCTCPFLVIFKTVIGQCETSAARYSTSTPYAPCTGLDFLRYQRSICTKGLRLNMWWAVLQNPLKQCWECLVLQKLKGYFRDAKTIKTVALICLPSLQSHQWLNIMGLQLRQILG